MEFVKHSDIIDTVERFRKVSEDSLFHHTNDVILDNTKSVE